MTMDARPQRPLRTLPIEGDENIPPSKQSLHQRHKSTGTLSTLLGVGGGLKMAAKRTAFGDVSNTAKIVGTVHDDTINKNTTEFLPKPAQPQEKNMGFLRPAQRPLNVMGLKGFVSNSNANISMSAPKGSVVDLQQQSQFTKPRTLSKRATTIYKDQIVANSSLPSQRANAPDSENRAPVPPAHQTIGPRQHKSQPQLKAGYPALQVSQNKYTAVSIENNQDDSDSTSPVDKGSAGHDINPVATEACIVSASYKESHDVVIQNGENNKRQDREPSPHPVSDPEEYWDEEEEEVYDEQGYATIHSYKSRSDNTTSGATTVLFPRITNRVKKELAIAKEIVESSRTVDEIEDEAWDTSMVAEYGDEIFQYMRELEIRMLPNAHYMDSQAEIQWSMRSVLMDWLVQVHHRFYLLPETLFLCVNYIDRFLSCKIVSLGKLQLVGATAIFVAAKYEETNFPSVNEIVYMVDGGYTSEEILKAERFMLSMLQFELGWPGPMSFLRRISKADEYDLETRTLAKYFLEVTIMDERFVGSPPSFVAAGAHCLARMMLKKGEWTPAHIYYSGYTWTQLKPLAMMILECCENPIKHHAAVFDKYSDRRYKRAALFVRDEIDRGFTLPSLSSQPRLSQPALEDVAVIAPFETHDALKRLVQIKG